MIPFAKYLVHLELTEPLLGTIASNPEVYKRFIASKAAEENPDETLAESSSEREQAGWTTFYRMPDNNEIACLMDYQIKGFIKEIGNTIKDNLGIKALRSKIDSDVFVKPRRIPLGKVNGTPLERPLRAMTMQGPRVSVVRSDIIEPGKKVDFGIDVRAKSVVTEEVLRDILDYGAYQGIGQWRNGGYGRFAYKLKQVSV